MNTAIAKTPFIPGYTIIEKIFRSTRTDVYRALWEEQQQLVVIKVLRHEHPSLSELVYFRNQFAIARHLNHSAIARPIALERCGNGYALVMPDEGFIALSTYWQQCDHISTNLVTRIPTVIAIAIQLADALHYLARERVIHKDIKPDNILIHPETRQIQLSDFSIASLIPKERQQLSNPKVLEGTLAYMSPEQTGRMNRGIDYRTDFYSLGVTLFELLTGELPFVTTEPLDLVHCHIARPVVFPDARQSNLPEMVRAIVVKLMAKNAEDRYQSALGLKHDLTICLQQWKIADTVSAFELGQHDVCDRFLIPEKLYGRDAEVQTLLESFDRAAKGASELMLVAGFSGMGKTAVVNEIHKPITRQNGYFIKGKFDQFNRSVPFSAFVQAFRRLMGQLLSESDAELQTWKTQILTALGENAQVIVELIPELERIIGSRPPAPKLSGIAAQNRFNLLFQSFIRVFTTPEHPLVIFLDDLQWIDSASLNLIRVLMSDMETGYLLLLGAYRDNEVFAAHPLMLLLEGLRTDGASVQTVTLQPLSGSSLNRWISDTLHTSDSMIQPLTELVMQKTRGNPFFATQFLKVLHQETLITFDYGAGCWQCDIAQVWDMALTDDVVEFVALQLQKLPESTQDILKLAACVGAQFDLETLAIVLEQAQVDVAIALWDALQEGLILPQSNSYKFYLGEKNTIQNALQVMPNYRFLHDRVQQAAYSLIPDDQKSATHLLIGQQLLAKTSSIQNTDNIFALVNQLNYGRQLIDSTAQKIELAQLNLQAARKAKAAVAYQAADTYCQSGIDLLGSDCWQNHYRLTLDLYNVAAEAAYLDGQYALMEQWLNEILHAVPTLLDQVTAYDVKIQARMAQNQLQECVATGLEVLKRLEVYLPPEPNPADLQQGFTTTAAQLAGKVPEELATLPVMTNPRSLAALTILASMWGATFSVAPSLMPLIVLEMVKLSVRDGNASISAFAYALYGVLLCDQEDFQTGYKFGELSSTLLTQLDAQAFKAKSLFLIGTHITIWREPIRQALPMLQNAYQTGLETGDLEFSALSAAIGSYYAYLAGNNLSDVNQKFVTYTQAVERIRQTYYLNFLHIWHQAITNLLGGVQQAHHLVGDICNCDDLLKVCERDRLTTPMAYIYINRLMLNYLFGYYANAVDIVPLADKYAQMVPATLLIPIANFYGSLSKLALCSQIADSHHATLLDAVEQNQDLMQRWSLSAPMNFLHKYELVEAERHRVLGNKVAAMEHYDRAIAGAKENGYVQEEALANELAARFYLDWGKEKVAQVYLLEAYYGYLNWGAKAKTDELERRYLGLLQPVLQPTTPSVTLFDTLSAIAPPNLSVHAMRASNTKASTNLNTALDFASVLQSSQAILNEIQLDALLQQLMQVMLQSSGGDRCVLVLPDSVGLWQVRAIATLDAIELCTAPLEGNPNHPLKLIQYVKNTQEIVVVDDLKTDLPIIDEYLSQKRPKSVLCLPILNQKRLIGIVQLSNQSTSGVFTYDRILPLNFLCTQAAISLENARLYHILEDYSQTLEGKVEERTIALQEKEERLRLALSATNQGFFDVNLQTGEAVVSPEYALMLGYDPATFHETDAAWRARLHPDDYERTSQAYRAYAAGQAPQYKVEFRQRTRQGTWKWILAMGKFIAWDGAGQPIRLLGTHRDISDRKFAEIQLEAQNTLLAQIAQGYSLSNVLNTLIETVEQTLDGVLCSILLVDNDDRLRYCAAPSLPDAYGQAVDGLLIGDGVGSCGTAAFRNETIIVADIATDSLWCPYKDLALSHGLRACWSSPITARGGQVLGTFAMYYKQVRSPRAHELSWIKQMAYIAGIAIERQEADTKIRRSEAKLLRAQQVAHVGNWEFDVASQKITWSPEMFRIYGLEPAPLAPSYAEYLQLLPVSDRLRLQQYIEQAVNDGTSYTIECSRVRPDGTPCHYECRAEAEKDAQGNVIRLFGTTLDITERKQAEVALQNLMLGTATTTGQDFFPALVQHIAQALGVSFAIVTEKVNDQLETLAFWANDRLMPPHVYPLAQTPCERVLETGEFYCESNVQQRFPHDPDLITLGADSYMGIALSSAQGEVLGHLCILHQQPIPHPEQAKQILRIFGTRAAAELERQRAEGVINQQLAAIEAAIDGIGILKGDTYLYVNQSHLRLLGYEQADDLVGHSWKKLYAPDEIKRFEQEVLPQLERERAWQGEVVATRKDGSTFAQSVSLTLGEDGLLICVCQDISDRKQAQELIIHNALHDPLTDLPNRTLLLERLDLAIQRAKRTENYRYAVLFLDLDRFKVINDSLGHVVGDHLLVAIAQRLKTHLRQIDLVARLGGDEFLILLEDIRSTEEVAQMAERILADCQTPLTIHDHQIFTSMSIGIVLGKPNYHQATDLIRDADIAMYQAKSHASNSYKFFDAAMHTEAIHRLTLETDLRQALDQQAFTLHYQPIVELSSQRLIGFEALVRWPHPTQGLIAPGAFIPIAEETGLISRIDSWVLHRACQQLAYWQRQFADGAILKVSINLSAQDLRNPSLIEDIDTLLATTGLTGQAITLEITESMLIKDIDLIIELLMQLTSRQIQISIDDFGTGYSSLNYLHRLPVHNLKIDRAFVSQMQSEHRNHQVVSTIITLSQQLGLTTIAEGIETPQQLELLQQLGCQLGQGYLFSQPLAAHEIESRFFHGDGAQ